MCAQQCADPVSVKAIINACCRNAEGAGDARRVFPARVKFRIPVRIEAAIRSGSGSWRVSILRERESACPAAGAV